MPLARSHREGPEADCYAEASGLVIGADEVGRGALAGPLTVAAVAFPAELFAGELPEDLAGVSDSKTLSPAERALQVPAIRARSSFAAIVHISNRRVDEIGINPATRIALEYLVARFRRCGLAPAQLLLDGRHDFHLGRAMPELRCRTIVGGDRECLSIAAASVLAKEARDGRMRRFGRLFPEFGFEKHKGYGTREHMLALDLAGPCALHRKSYLRANTLQLELPWLT